MATNSVTCPTCSALLATSPNLPPTKRVQCPRCKSTFQISVTAEYAATIGAARTSQTTAPTKKQVAPQGALSPAQNGSQPVRKSDYFFSHDGIDVGPITLEQFVAFAKAGRIHADDLVWSAGDDQRLTAARMQQLLGVELFASPQHPATDVVLAPDATTTPVPVQRQESSSNFLKSLLVEPFKVLRVIAAQLTAIGSTVLQSWRSQLIVRNAQESHYQLGLRLEALRWGGPATLTALTDVRHKISDSLTNKDDSPRFQSEMRTLVMALAEQALRSESAMPQAEPEFTAARAAKTAVEAHQQHASKLQRSLLPPDRPNRLRLAAAYSAVICIALAAFLYPWTQTRDDEITLEELIAKGAIPSAREPIVVENPHSFPSDLLRDNRESLTATQDDVNESATTSDESSGAAPSDESTAESDKNGSAAEAPNPPLARVSVGELSAVRLQASKGENWGSLTLTSKEFERKGDVPQKQYDRLHALGISPDGKTIALTAFDKKTDQEAVVIFDVPSRSERAVLVAQPRPFVFSPNSQYLAVTVEGDVLVWDLAANEPRGVFSDPNLYADSLAFSADGSRIAATLNTYQEPEADEELLDAAELTRLLYQGNRRKTVSDVAKADPDSQQTVISVWDLISGKEAGKPLKTESPATSLALSSNGDLAAVGCEDGGIEVWSVDAAERYECPKQFSNPIETVTFSPDGKTLVTQAEEKSATLPRIVLWNVGKKLEPRGTLQDEYVQNRATLGDDICFDRDGNICTLRFGRFSRWKTGNGEMLDTIKAPLNTYDLEELSGDLRTQVYGTKLRDLSGYLTKEVQPRAVLKHPVSVESVVFTQDGQYIVSCGGKDGSASGIAAWKADANGDIVKPAKVSAGAEGQRPFYLLASSPASNVVAACAKRRTIEKHAPGTASFGGAGGKIVDVDEILIWDLTSGKSHTVPCPRPVTAIAFSTDGKLLAAAFANRNRFSNDTEESKPYLELLDVESGKWKGPLGGTLEAPCSSIAFSNSGKTIALALGTSGGENWWPIMLRDLRTGRDRLLNPHKEEIVSTVTFLPDDRLVTCGNKFLDESIVGVWNISSDEREGEFEVPLLKAQMCVSPDGSTIAVGGVREVFQGGGSNKAISVIDLASGSLRKNWLNNGLKREGDTLCFSPDGKTLATVNTDNTVFVWNLSSDSDRIAVNLIPAVATTKGPKSNGQAEAQVLAMRGGAYAKLGMPDKAQQNLDAALQLDPRNRDAGIQKALLARNRGDFEQALAECDEMLRMDGNNGSAYALRGAIRASLKKYPEALADFTRAVELNPNELENRLIRAEVLMQLDKFSEAADELRRMIQAEPQNGYWYQCRAQVLLAAKKYPEAIEDCTKAISICRPRQEWNEELTPDLARLIRLRATMKQAMGDANGFEGDKQESEQLLSEFGDARHERWMKAQIDRLMPVQPPQVNAPSAAAIENAQAAREDAMRDWMNQKAGMLGAEGIRFINYGAGPGPFQ